MKAITLKQNGSVENFTFTEIETPAIHPDQVLVKVKAIGINPVDAFVRQNPQGLLTYLKPHKGEDTFIVGWDVSGVVEEVGPEVTRFKQGDAVFGLVNFPGHAKAYAEYLAAPVGHLALKPANISHQEAAGATLAALTAWQALVTYAKVRPGDKVLIHAAAGGVGHYAVQIAKHFGAYVIGTASAANRDFVLELGADEFIDYTRERFEDKVKDADVVLDAIYGDHIFRSLEAVKKGGRLISLLTFIEGKVAENVKEKEVFAHRLNVVSNGEDMQQIAALLESGLLRSHISQTYSFQDLPKAHQQVETGKTRGKIVVNL
jgi:NADPH:quinone reductase-like Zn-dependent oxidoreductase